MTAFWIRAAFAAAGALALQACEMPHSQYAPYEGYHTPGSTGPVQPQYPTTDAAPAAPADPHDPVARPSEGVSGQPLAPAQPAGPSSAIAPRFVYASTPWVRIGDAFHNGDNAFLYQAAYHRRRVRRVEVNSHGRLEATSEGEVQQIKVRKGDTVRKLAIRYGTTIAAIMKANGLKRPTDLAVGMPLTIPSLTASSTRAGTASAATAREERAETAREAREDTGEAETTRPGMPATYRTQRGDTIYAIGRKFKISPIEIEQLNGFSPSTHLRTGQVVKLPGATTDETVAGRQVAVVDHPRPHTTIPSPTASLVTSDSQPPDHMVPYSSLPGHVVPYANLPGHVVPPQRPLVPPVAVMPPQQQPQPPAGPPDAQVVLAGRGLFTWPVNGPILSGFGPKPGGQNNDGVDISAPDGAPVRASASGDVVYAGNAVPGFGNVVLIKHEDGWVTVYAHLSRTEVKIKDHVSQGDEIGQVGESGGASQPEVHFEIRYAPTPRDKAKPVDPQLLLSSQ